MKSKCELKIDWATHEAAKFACENWHYSRCLTSSMQKHFKIGAWEDGKFVGLILFGHGANHSIGDPYGLTTLQVCELTRVAFKRGHKTPISKCVAIALKFLKRSNPGLRLVVSYADTGQGHHGGIYQAGNWIYSGISKRVSPLWFNGRKWHAKALRTSFPTLKHSDPRVKKLPASVKHKYLMPLDDEMRRRILPLAKPYPKRVGSRDNAASGFHSEEGGANPTPALQSRVEVPNGG